MKAFTLDLILKMKIRHFLTMAELCIEARDGSGVALQCLVHYMDLPHFPAEQQIVVREAADKLPKTGPRRLTDEELAAINARIDSA